MINQSNFGSRSFFDVWLTRQINFTKTKNLPLLISVAPSFYIVARTPFSLSIIFFRSIYVRVSYKGNAITYKDLTVDKSSVFFSYLNVKASDTPWHFLSPYSSILAKISNQYSHLQPAQNAASIKIETQYREFRKTHKLTLYQGARVCNVWWCAKQLCTKNNLLMWITHASQRENNRVTSYLARLIR